MKSHHVTNLLLAAIALLLFALVVGPFRDPSPVLAQSPDTDFYFEPGTFLVRAPDNSQKVYAMVVVDLRNGRVRVFPTLTTLPYPSDPIYNKAQTSHPFFSDALLSRTPRRIFPKPQGSRGQPRFDFTLLHAAH